jgi:DUF1680 family protein
MLELPPAVQVKEVSTASGYNPYRARYVEIRRQWHPGDRLVLDFAMDIQTLRPHPRVKSCRGRGSFSRGPVVYCLESFDNPGVDLFEDVIASETLKADYSEEHFGGAWVLRGETTTGKPVTFIPYNLWANRGRSQMTVFPRIV